MLEDDFFKDYSKKMSYDKVGISTECWEGHMVVMTCRANAD